MSDRTQVDLEKLLRGGGMLHGEIGLAVWPELADRLASTEGVVAWSLQGSRDVHGRPRLGLALRAGLQLTCQRCLASMPFTLQHQHALVVVKGEDAMPELEDEDDDADFVVVPGLFDVQDAVLEELLLALPMMPRHETEQCHGPKDGPETADDGKVSPFAVLRGSSGN